MISGKRAIVPSSLVNSQSTAQGASPASFIRSMLPSVWPLRSLIPPERAINGNICPGWWRDSGVALGAMAVRIVCMRSAADTPVVTPSAASIEMVNAVPYLLVFCSTINGKFSCRAFSSVMHRQTMPLQCRIIMAMSASVILWAEKIRSPSFSRFSSSTRRIPLPSQTAVMALWTLWRWSPNWDSKLFAFIVSYFIDLFEYIW